MRVKSTVLFLLLSLQCLTVSARAESPAGVFYYDSENAPTVALAGVWKFSCDDALPDHAEPLGLNDTITVPGTWRGKNCPQGALPGTGRHRFHLRIEGRMRPYGLGIYLPVAGTSMIAYWNGYRIHQAGEPADAKPGYKAITLPIAFSDVNDLVIDVVNYNDRYGGLWAAPVIGRLEDLYAIRKYRFAMDGIVAGILLFAALYNTGVYLGMRKRAYLYLAFFAFLMALRTLAEGERIGHALFGDTYWAWLVRVAHLGIYAGALVFFLFLRDLLGVSRWQFWEIAPLSMLIVYDLLVIFTPPAFFTEFLNAALFALILGYAILLYHAIRAVKRRKAGGVPILTGLLLLLLAMINDALLHFLFIGAFEIGSFELAPVALIVFTFLSSANLEFTEYRLRQSVEKLQSTIEARSSAVRKLLPALAAKFVQARSSQEARLLARETLHVRFAVLFADLRGFTTLTENLGPQEAFVVINRYLETVVPAIMAEGGQVLEYQGDGILAFFTTGADSCLRAAQNMHGALGAAMEKKYLPELKMGIALHTGSGDLALLGNYRRLEPAIVSPAILEVQDLENLCGFHGVTYALSEQFFADLSRPNQAATRILTDLNGRPVFTLSEQ
ncbi:MAG: hypothetical protein OHK0011_07870 [Turneriella sp.]